MSVPIRIANFYGVRRRRLLDPNQQELPSSSH